MLSSSLSQVRLEDAVHFISSLCLGIQFTLFAVDKYLERGIPFPQHGLFLYSLCCCFMCVACLMLRSNRVPPNTIRPSSHFFSA